MATTLAQIETLCGSSVMLVADHCHSSGKFRGTLCNGCNAALGFLREDPKIIDALKEYIQTWQQL